MTPTPTEEKSIPRSIAAGARLAHPEPGNEVVISGLSGRFPDSDDVYEFRDKLFNKVDLVSDDGRRWKLDHPEIPQRTGKINHVSKFDAAFFGVHYKQAHTMDPMCRILLERAYEAVVDAGINPRSLRGSRCGVFIGACFSESEKTWFYEKIQVNGFGITGCSRAMLANRISYWLGVNGPSYTVDSACSSSLYALEHAYKAIRDGHCDAAFVGGSNLCLHPYVSLQFSRLGVLSQDGSCKSFDNNANGYCRSEAIPMIFLQKKKDARRIYATIVHAKTNCDGYKEQGITYPSGQMQYELLREFYEECGVNPATLNFIEAHGTGTKVGDPEECNALDKIFCKGRKDPLWIGSVKSNIGHSEPASGLCSITKVIIAMESGFIPPNLHFSTPREGIPAFTEGRLKVVTEKQPWEGGLAGVNSFGFGGANCHVLLRWNEKEKINGGAPKDSIPRLVVVSGRTEEACKVILDDLESRPTDVEFVKLLHEIHSDEIPGHIYRGFTVLTNTDRKIRDIQYFSGQKRKIWFVFSGMGSQWPGMGKSLMKIPVFAQAIERCHNIIQPKGMDLIKIITDEDPKIFDNILHSFVGIAAIQIGLVDVLKTIGIFPDYIIGHSVGELGCAYADGCLTAEQMILSAYYRGLASIETEFIKGSMAAVGMGYTKIKDILPPEIDVACHNGPDSCTLSGPQEVLKKFLMDLTSQGVFAREVPCSNIPYHSRYIAKAGPKLLQYLHQVILYPKPRSSKWICSSIPESNWGTPLAKHSSAEYYTNNLLSPVLFEEASRHIPAGAITIEIAPHGLLQAILKRSLKKDTTNVALTQRGHADNAQVLLTGIGKLYEAGVEVQLQNLYPHVPYPVSRSTPMISPLIRWEHSEDWYVTTYRLQEKIKSGERTISISLSDEDMEFLSGHVIDGRNLFPATGYLALVWETIGMMKGELYTQLSIVFENVKFNRATNIPKEGTVDFIVMVQKGSGNFEVVEGGAPIVTGRAYVPEDITVESAKLPALKPSGDDVMPLNSRDIYKELKLRGYHYTGLFRGLLNLDGSGTCGTISWSNNYVAFMDNMLQTQILQEDTRSLYVPTSIQKLVIDAKKHMELIHEMNPEGEQSFPVYVYRDVNIIRSGGIEIRSLKASQIPRRKPLGDPVLEKYLFVPHIIPANEKQDLDLLEAIRLCVHLALENVQGVKVKVTEVGDETVLPESIFVSPYVASILGDLPLIQAEIILLSSSSNEKAKELGPGVIVEDKKLTADQTNLILVGSNILGRTELLQQALGAIKTDGFLLVRESPQAQLSLDAFHVWVDRVVDGERIMLLRKNTKLVSSAKPEIVKISEKDGFNWLEPLKTHVKNNEVTSVILVAEKEMRNGLMGLTNCLRKEPGGERIRCVFVMDNNAPAFDINNPFYASQISKGLAVNVFKNGKWGSFRHQALPEPKKEDLEYMYMNTSVRGDLSSFKFYESPLSENPHYASGSKAITVYYSAINFRDVMVASGKLALDVIARGRIEQEIVIGFEFAGRYKESGKRIMGMISRGALTSVIGENSAGYIAWDVPDNWSLAEAATIPVVYGTVYTALVTNGRMQKGDSILIHSGTGGVGLAAINVALFYGCTVFTTVGTPEKRDYIRKMFPQIPDNHIGNSRDTSFEQMIKYETNGRGVDMVLNSLAEEKLLASVRCLADNGRFLEIGKFDLANNNPLGMEAFLRGISFHGVQLDAIFNASELRKRELKNILQWALNCGSVKPLKRTVFDVTECEQAFRYMTTGKHMGKVLLKLRDEEPEKVFVPKPRFFPAEPRFFAADNKTYVVIGGLGGFGLELTDWLAIRGARNIVVTSRTGIRNGYQALRIRIWKTYGVRVIVSTDDITTEEGVTNMLKTANSLGPVAGIFNLAVVLRDALFENQTEEDYRISFGGKAVATQHLDKISRKLCPELKYFVVFSSVSCGRGNAGQTNYGMSNSIMERICESRVQEGLPGLAIQWGAIGDVGLVADMQEDHQELVIGGTLQQSISSCLQCLDILLKQTHPIVASMVVAEKRAGGSGSGDIVDTVVNIMGIRDLKTVSMHSSLAELGMDSMMAVEIKQTLEREFEVFLTAQDIRSLTFAKLAELGQKNEEQATETSKNPDGITARVPDKTGQGLNLILRLVGEEIAASEPIIALDSKAGDAVANVHTPTPSKPPVFLIPGLEGMAAVFTDFAANINHPTLCLQYPYDDPANSDITQIAQYMHNTLKTRLPKEVPFVLVGHSTGALVGLELAYLLEAEGRTGKLFLLDGSPDLLKYLCSVALGSGSDEEFDTALLMTMHNLFVPGTNEKVKDDLNNFKTWDEKLERLMAILPDTVPHSRRHQKVTAFDLRQRLKAIVQYENKHISKLMLKIMLIRPNEQVMPNLLPDDYNLSKFSDQPIKVHFVDGNHLSMLENKKVAQIINTNCAQHEDASLFKSSIMSLDGVGSLKEKEKHRTH